MCFLKFRLTFFYFFFSINKLKNRSIYDEEIELTSNDEILILQTCSSLEKYRNYEKKYLLIILRRVLNEEI